MPLALTNLLTLRASSGVMVLYFIEMLFAIPGAGFYLVKSLDERDYPVVLAYVVLWGSILMSLTSIAEILIKKIDPRIGENAT